MEELHHTAETYYKAGSDDLKKAARAFYEAMDYNSDGQIGLHEYLAFMRREGYTHICNRDFFSQLCTLNKQEKTNSLGFSQVLTLFYIIHSGRPLCDGCGDLIKGLFFTCVKCFDSSSFDVCPHCYGHGLYEHDTTHGQFLDNFAILRLKKTAPPKPNSGLSATLVEIDEDTKPSSTSQALVVADPNKIRRMNWRSTLQIVGAAINVANLCTIM